LLAYLPVILWALPPVISLVVWMWSGGSANVSTSTTTTIAKVAPSVVRSLLSPVSTGTGGASSLVLNNDFEAPALEGQGIG